jgi:hypothetical protein
VPLSPASPRPGPPLLRAPRHRQVQLNPPRQPARTARTHSTALGLAGQDPPAGDETRSKARGGACTSQAAGRFGPLYDIGPLYYIGPLYSARTLPGRRGRAGVAVLLVHEATFNDDRLQVQQRTRLPKGPARLALVREAPSRTHA